MCYFRLPIGLDCTQPYPRRQIFNGGLRLSCLNATLENLSLKNNLDCRNVNPKTLNIPQHFSSAFTLGFKKDGIMHQSRVHGATAPMLFPESAYPI